MSYTTSDSSAGYSSYDSDTSYWSVYSEYSESIYNINDEHSYAINTSKNMDWEKTPQQKKYSLMDFSSESLYE